MKSTFNPRSKDYWGASLWPMELEDARNKKEIELHKSVRRILNSGKFKKLRWTTRSFSSWETPEERINQAYKQPGFWVLPPSQLDFFKLRYSELSEFKGEYKIPFYVLLNKEIDEYAREQVKLSKAKKKLNDEVEYQILQKKIDELEQKIESICYNIYEVVFQYAAFFIGHIGTSSDVVDYENDRFTSDRLELIGDFETYFYGAAFGNEYAIYEGIDFFVKAEDKEKHIALLSELIPLVKEYLLCQITKEHFKRGDYGKWDLSKNVVKDILNRIGKIEELNEQSVIDIFNNYDELYIPPTGRVKLVKSDGFLNKKQLGEDIAGIIMTRDDIDVDDISGKHIRNKIDRKEGIKYDCKYWKPL